MAVVLKQAGVGLHPPQKGQRGGAVSVDAWAGSALTKSRLPDALVRPCAVSPLNLDGVRGPVAVAKTLSSQQALLDGRRDTSCVYTAVLTSLDYGSDPDSVVSVLQSVEASTFAELHLVEVRTHAERDARQLAQSLPVLGIAAKVPGGIHMSLTSLELPPELRGGVVQSAFTDAVPRKFEKTMTRETLHARRRRQAASEPDAGESVVEFSGLAFTVPTQQLRPRPSSECLVDAAVRAAQSSSRPACILDLGCGCGALMLSALHALPEGAAAVGIDIDAAALEAARANAAAILGPQRTERAVQLLHGDFSQLHTPGLRSQLPAEGVSIVVCNPPYLREAAARGRTTDESSTALFAGSDGLSAYHSVVASLVQAVPPLLRPDGLLILQLPASSVALRAVQQICMKHGLRPVWEPVLDGRGVARALVLTWGA